jgi:arylsulfatase A-like enzyme
MSLCKKFMTFMIVASAGVALGATAPDSRSEAETAEGQPNIIFVLLDDLGKEWISCYGAEGIDTPNIDKLAASGMRFNNAYSMPQCTPSRACFMTGQYPFRSGWVNHWDAPRWGVGYFDWKRNPSIARTMKSAGYVTGVSGKWQLNDFRIQPDAMSQHGFDEYFMWTGFEKGNRPSGERYWNPYIHSKEGSRTYKAEFGPDLYNQFLLDFISENKEKPFFFYYAMALPHGPLVHTPHEPNVTDKMDKHRAMVRYIDHLTGKLVDHLETLGLREKTIIVWTTDNGTGGKSNIMNGRTVRGGKAKTTENGVNAPFIVSCPGLIPAGTVSDALVDFSDMHTTFADFAGVMPEAGYEYDGISVKDVFTGKAAESNRKWILAMGCKPARLTDKGVENVYYFRDRVVREARYKLFVGTDRQPEKLVDLQKDPAEKNNLLGNPEYAPIVKRLLTAIKNQPTKDNDPIYDPLPANSWDKKPEHKSQVHKKGAPQTP